MLGCIRVGTFNGVRRILSVTSPLVRGFFRVVTNLSSKRLKWWTPEMLSRTPSSEGSVFGMMLSFGSCLIVVKIFEEIPSSLFVGRAELCLLSCFGVRLSSGSCLIVVRIFEELPTSSFLQEAESTTCVAGEGSTKNCKEEFILGNHAWSALIVSQRVHSLYPLSSSASADPRSRISLLFHVVVVDLCLACRARFFQTILATLFAHNYLRRNVLAERS